METALVDRGRLSLVSQARALCVAGAMAFGQGDSTAVAELCDESLVLAQAAHDRRVMAIVLYLLGDSALLQREYESATKYLEQALHLFRELDDSWGTSLALDRLAQVALAQGDDERATRMFEENLALGRKVGDATQIAESLTNLGLVAQGQGEYQRAIQLHGESLAVCRESGLTTFASTTLRRMGWTSLLVGDHEEAATALEESLALVREQGNTLLVADILLAMAMAALLHADHVAATSMIHQSLALTREVDAAPVTIDCVEALAAVAAAQGQAHRAATLAGAVEGLRDRRGAPISPALHTLCTRYLANAPAPIGEAAWAAAWSLGHRMTLDEAIDYAHQEKKPDAMESALEPSPGAAAAMLTPREREVAALLARGLTNSQIASALSMAPRTADTHVSRILQKLGLASRSHVAATIDPRGSPMEHAQ
jgi:non-specific serine/threonine protein kinase